MDIQRIGFGAETIGRWIQEKSDIAIRVYQATELSRDTCNIPSGGRHCRSTLHAKEQFRLLVQQNKLGHGERWQLYLQWPADRCGITSEVRRSCKGLRRVALITSMDQVPDNLWSKLTSFSSWVSSDWTGSRKIKFNAINRRSNHTWNDPDERCHERERWPEEAEE